MQPGDVNGEMDGSDVVTVLTAIDKDSRRTFAVAIPSKKWTTPSAML